MRQRHSDIAAQIALVRGAISWRKVLLLALVCTGLAVLVATPAVHAVLLDVIQEGGVAIGRYPHAGPVLFIVLSALSAALAFFSVAMLVPIAVIAWGGGLTILYLWAGWVLGGLLGYLGGRVLGRPLLLWLSPASFSWLESRIRTQTSFRTALLMQLLLPSEMLGCAFGIADYRLKNYLAVLLLGEFPYAVGSVLLGDSIISGRSGLLFGAGTALILALLLAFVLLRRRVARGAPAKA